VRYATSRTPGTAEATSTNASISSVLVAPETREAQVQVASDTGRVTLSGASSTDEMLAFVEVASAVPGVRDVAYRTNPGDEVRPRFH